MQETINSFRHIRDVIDYWQASSTDWFSQNPGFDKKFRDRFARLHEHARHGELANWEKTADGCLALLILLDQYPRNAFRGTSRMYDTDTEARRIARHMVDLDLVPKVPRDLQIFCLLPFSHSENPADQMISVSLHEAYLPSGTGRARRHQKIIEQYGRFPHRNSVLGRQSRLEERRYLQNGGFRG